MPTANINCARSIAIKAPSRARAWWRVAAALALLPGLAGIAAAQAPTERSAQEPRINADPTFPFANEVAAFAKEHGGDEAMKPFVTPLSAALGHLQQATGWLMQNALTKPDNAGAAATDYMQLFGLVTFAYMWARMAKVAQDKIAATGATPYLTTKLVTGRFFMERMLPETSVHLARIQSGSATTMELAAEAF